MMVTLQMVLCLFAVAAASVVCSDDASIVRLFLGESNLRWRKIRRFKHKREVKLEGNERKAR